MPLSQKFPRRSRIAIVGMVVFLSAILLFTNDDFFDLLDWYFNKKTVKEQVSLYEGPVAQRLQPLFAEKQIEYPPKHVTLLFIKDQKKMYLFAGHNQFNVKHVKTYNVLAASGVSGPKLQENDKQVPEGIYSVDSLNPNSRYHLALRVNYPNEFDIEKGKLDGRSELGSDIMIHGSNVSVGCVALGDEAIEELFVLAAKSKYENWKLIFSPTDMKTRVRETRGNEPSWISELDQKLLHAFLILP